MGNKYLDTDLLDRAIIFAVKAHANTERRGKGFPYIVHPMEAVEIAATITKDQEILAAAALHDTVEDTDVTIDIIREQFGDRIARLVEAESDVFVEGQTEEESWHQRKQAAIDRLAAAPYDAKIVAMGDKLSNMRAIARDFTKMGDELWKIFHTKDPREHEWHYRGLAQSLSDLSDTFAYSEFVTLIQQVFTKAGHNNDTEMVLVDMNDYTLSGEGFTAQTYNHKDGDTIIKLYKSFVPAEVPIKERTVAQKILALGIDTPSSGRLVTDGERKGVEFQRISPKKSFSRAISQEPERLEEYAVRFAHQCKAFHSIQCDTSFFPNAKDIFYDIVDKSTLYGPEDKKRIKEFIYRTPHATTCIHGDMHIGNIIVTPDDGKDWASGEKEYWIDLADFRYGNPLFDMGMWYFVTHNKVEPMIIDIFHLTCAQMLEVWKIFVREYFPGEKLEDVDNRCKPYAALMMMQFCNQGTDTPDMKETIYETFKNI